MSQDLTSEWRQESPSIYAAYLTGVRERDIYVGYVATTPGRDMWRGYIGAGFTPVGIGPQAVMRRVVEQRGRDLVAWARDTVDEAARDRRSVTGARNERGESGERWERS